jgi:hypothetical protein
MDFLALRENMGRKKEKPAVRWNCKPRKELTGGRLALLKRTKSKTAPKNEAGRRTRPARGQEKFSSGNLWTLKHKGSGNRRLRTCGPLTVTPARNSGERKIQYRGRTTRLGISLVRRTQALHLWLTKNSSAKTKASCKNQEKKNGNRDL